MQLDYLDNGNDWTEKEHTKKFVEYLEYKQYRYVHIPNEAPGKSHKGKQSKNLKGFPDFVVWTGEETLYIEMKKVKGSKIYPEQSEWIEFLRRRPATRAAICHGWIEAVEFVSGEKDRSKKVS